LAAAVSEAGFPSFAAWESGTRPSDPSNNVLASLQLGGLGVTNAVTAMNAARFAGDFEATVLSNRIIYRYSGSEISGRVMVDLGNRILIDKTANTDAVRAALLMMAARFPENRGEVTGGKQFQKLVYKIAMKEGVRLDGRLGRAQDRREAANRMILLAARLFHNREWLTRSFHWPLPTADGPLRQIPNHPATIDDIVATVPRRDADNTRHPTEGLPNIKDESGAKPSPAEVVPDRQQSDEDAHKAAARAAAARAAAIQAGFGR